MPKCCDNPRQYCGTSAEELMPAVHAAFPKGWLWENHAENFDGIKRGIAECVSWFEQEKCNIKLSHLACSKSAYIEGLAYEHNWPTECVGLPTQEQLCAWVNHINSPDANGMLSDVNRRLDIIGIDGVSFNFISVEGEANLNACSQAGVKYDHFKVEIIVSKELYEQQQAGCCYDDFCQPLDRYNKNISCLVSRIIPWHWRTIYKLED